MYKNPSPEDQQAFLIRLYFGAGSDAISLCIKRAYLDFNRTLHGISRSPGAFASGSASLVKALTKLRDRDKTQESFDTWHENTCNLLITAYDTEGFNSFYIGQAQKWVNMVLKYIFVYGEERIPGYKPFYPFCHVPVDRIILQDSEFKKLANFSGAWSRINNYSNYMAFQVAVRERFRDSSPLAVEFFRWQADNSVAPAMLDVQFLRTVFSDDFIFSEQPHIYLEQHPKLTREQRNLALEIHASDLYPKEMGKIVELINSLSTTFLWQNNSEGPLLFVGKILFLLDRYSFDAAWFIDVWGPVNLNHKRLY